ncbi:MAG: hypothetical protein ACE5I7_16735 [Candidatus Binatia bacterium]
METTVIVRWQWPVLAVSLVVTGALLVGYPAVGVAQPNVGAVLGGAGPNNCVRDFPNAPVANTWFAQATANSIAGVDVSGGSSSDIGAGFNSRIDKGCLPGISGWYYGFDGNPPPDQLDLLPTLLHELAHGLGFLTVVDLSTGAKFMGFDDTFMLNLEDNTTGKLYPAMTDAERVAASINTGNLLFVGANVRAASSVLSAGKVGDAVLMFAPNPQQPGSSVSHFDTSLTPDELMEPFDTPTHMQKLTEALFEDIGWTLLLPGTPTATRTVTPTVTLTPTVTPTPTVAPPPACPATPQSGCRTPSKSILVLKDKPGGSKDRLIWKWLKGPVTSFAELGDPVGNLSSYSLCVYDESADAPSLVMSAGVPAGGTCANNKPCWKQLGRAANPKGFKYRNTDLTADGLLKIILKKGAIPGGPAKVIIIGKGANLPLPGPVGATYLNQDTTVTVQLIKSDGGVCWGASYPAPAIKNQSELFKDKM